jgi:hypothetical protein
MPSVPLRPIIVCLLGLIATPASAASWYDLSDHRWSFVAEGGARFASGIDVSSANQPNATKDWGGTAAQYRAEAWLTKPGALNLGLVLQPFDQTFRGTLSSTVTAKGQTLLAGQPGTYNVQFPNIRLTGNYPVWSRGESELRLGVTLIARYAEETLKSDQGRIKVVNTLALPLLNIEGRLGLGGGFAAVTRADLLPAENGTGIYDVFYGIRRGLDDRRAIELGGRFFYGGYFPNEINRLNGRIAFNGVVARLVF